MRILPAEKIIKPGFTESAKYLLTKTGKMIYIEIISSLYRPHSLQPKEALNAN